MKYLNKKCKQNHKNLTGHKIKDHQNTINYLICLMIPNRLIKLISLYLINKLAYNFKIHIKIIQILINNNIQLIFTISFNIKLIQV